jgi:hypothetical protein
MEFNVEQAVTSILTHMYDDNVRFVNVKQYVEEVGEDLNVLVATVDKACSSEFYKSFKKRKIRYFMETLCDPFDEENYKFSEEKLKNT